MYRRLRRERALTMVVALGSAAALVPSTASVATSAGAQEPSFSTFLADSTKIEAIDGTGGDHFGDSIGMSGTTLVVGVYGKDDNGARSGAAYVYDRDHGGSNRWGLVRKLLAPDGAEFDDFGLSVGISADTIAVGSLDDSLGNASGAVYLFERHEGGSDNWGFVKKLTASDGAEDDGFGGSLGISGDTLVVGAPGNDDAGSESGSAYVFERDHGGSGNWGEVKKLVAGDATASDNFGSSIATFADTAVVGARQGDLGEGAGSVYIFERHSGGADNWGEVKKVIGSDTAPGDSFGWSVTIHADTIVAGAPDGLEPGDGSGSAYVFERDLGGAGNWGEARKLNAGGAAAGDQFGYAVAIAGDTVAVGARHDSDVGVREGSVVMFERDQGGADNWGQTRELHVSDVGSSAHLGVSVALAPDVIVAGASTHEGAVYAFEPGPDYYVLDGYGGVHAGGDAPVLTPAAPYFGFDIARDLELSANGAYVLDGFGGVHPAGGEAAFVPGPPYFGFGIAWDIELATGGGGGYVLDGFGGVHTMGGAPVLTPQPPYFGFDVARDLELGNGGFYVLDGWGGLHPGGGAPPISPGPPYFGFDIAKDLELVPGGGYVLDGFGGVHPVGGLPALLPSTRYFGSDRVEDLELLAGGGHFVLEANGVIYRGGQGKPLFPPLPPAFGFDVARDLEIR